MTQAKRCVLMTVVVSLIVLVSGYGGVAQAQCVSPSPRTVPVKVVNIRNNSAVGPIWVVLETPKQDLLDDQEPPKPHDRWLQAEFNPTPGTYASTYLYRAYINPLNGIPKDGGSVSVTLPFFTQLEASPCPFEADQYINWWRALRIYVYDDPGAIKNAYDTDTNTQNATPISSLSPPPPLNTAVPSCSGASCETANPVVYRIISGGDQHGVSLSPNDPSQLLEFTFATVTAAPEPLKIDHGFVDYDISSVDQVYLPVAMDPVNNPFIGFIGSDRGRNAFNTRLNNFVTDFGWPKYNWPDYVTNRDKSRLPATYNVMKEIAHPGAPPPFCIQEDSECNVASGPALKQLPVIQKMHALWSQCCGANWPESGSRCQKPQKASATCDKIETVSDLFEKNYANYRQLCQDPAALTRDFMLEHVYGWVPFNECVPGVTNELKDTPGIGPKEYHKKALAYVDLQYHSPPPQDNPTTFGDFNRYVELIHSAKYLQVGEYAFSIDDAAGNMLEVGDGVNLTVGGATGLGNTNPYDPWRFFMFNVGAADQNGLVWTKYRICTTADPVDCPSMPPDRTMKEAGIDKGKIGYAGIKIGAVPCPCVIVLQDSSGTLYKVVVARLPAPPPTHPIDDEGDPPTAEDANWTEKKAEGGGYVNASCFDTETSFDWCSNLIPASVFDEQVQRTVYHVNTSAPVVPTPGVRFLPGKVTANLSNDNLRVTVNWPKAVTQPKGRQVTYELTLWDRANCPKDGQPCDHHASIPLQGTCTPTAENCTVTLSTTVPPLTAETLKSLSVVAKDPDGHIAAIEANFDGK